MAGFLERLEPDERHAFAAVATPRRCPRGASLFREGDDPGAVYVITSGWVKISTSAPDGRDLLLAIRGAGEVLGELSALAVAPRSATLTAAEPVEALTVSSAAFRALVERYPGIATVLLGILSERLLAADRRCVELAAFEVLGRLALRLLDLAATVGRPGAEGGIEITLPLTQEELASWTGASREAVSRALGTLRGLGCIAVARRRITVLDAAALSRHAGA